MLNRTQAPLIHQATDFTFTLPAITKSELKNGIPFYYINTGVQEVCQLEFVFKAGTWYETKNGIANTMCGLLKNGTTSKTALQINETLEQYGIHLKASASADWASISISCLSKNLKYGLPLLMELLQEANFPQHELDIYIQNQKQRLSVNLKKSDFIANRLIDEYYFGNKHAYGKYMSLNDYDLITSQDLQKYLHAYFTSTNCQLFFAGKYTNAEINLIEETVGKNNWNNSTKIETETRNIISQDQKKYRVVQDENSVQGSVRMLRSFPPKTHPDFTPMIVLNTVFGGYFGSRLMSNIREEKGYTYGIYSHLMNNKFDGGLIIATEAGKEVCENVVEEIYKEMDIIKTQPIDEEELQLVKNYLLGSILGDLDGAFPIIQRWKNIILNNFPEERFYKNIEIYKNIDAKKLQELANTYLVKDDFYELIVT
jgi:predicted Zn-dependent peptidase